MHIHINIERVCAMWYSTAKEIAPLELDTYLFHYLSLSDGNHIWFLQTWLLTLLFKHSLYWKWAGQSPERDFLCTVAQLRWHWKQHRISKKLANIVSCWSYNRILNLAMWLLFTALVNSLICSNFWIIRNFTTCSIWHTQHPFDTPNRLWQEVIQFCQYNWTLVYENGQSQFEKIPKSVVTALWMQCKYRGAIQTDRNETRVPQSSLSQSQMLNRSFIDHLLCSQYIILCTLK